MDRLGLLFGPNFNAPTLPILSSKLRPIVLGRLSAHSLKIALSDMDDHKHRTVSFGMASRDLSYYRCAYLGPVATDSQHLARTHARQILGIYPYLRLSRTRHACFPLKHLLSQHTPELAARSVKLHTRPVHLPKVPVNPT